MSQLEQAIERCLLSPASTLDLTDVGESSSAHDHYLGIAAIAWWLLSTSEPPARLRVRTTRGAVLQRAGVIGARGARRVELELADEHDRLDGEVRWAEFVEPPMPARCVVIRNLAESSNRPPDADDHGRRYHWMAALVGAQEAKMTPKLRKIAVSDASRCLYELVDNVHRWSQAHEAIATVFVTRGGGELSFDRLHIVVMDSGRGIIGSVLDDPKASAVLPGALFEDPTGLLRHFMEKAFGDRELPHHNGHGLHVSQLLTKEWAGRIDVLSSDSRFTGTVHHARSTVANGIEARPSFEFPGISGTLVSVTLNLTALTDNVRAQLCEEEQEALELFA